MVTNQICFRMFDQLARSAIALGAMWVAAAAVGCGRPLEESVAGAEKSAEASADDDTSEERSDGASGDSPHVGEGLAEYCWRTEARLAGATFLASLVGFFLGGFLDGRLGPGELGGWAGIFCTSLAGIFLAIRWWKFHKQEKPMRPIQTAAYMLLLGIAAFLSAFFFEWDQVYWALDRFSFLAGLGPLVVVADRLFSKIVSRIGG